MKYYHSLRFRIITGFCIFGGLLAITYGVYIIVSYTWVEDTVFNNHLQLEINDYLFRYSINPKTPLPNSIYLKSYIGKEKMSEFERSLTRDLTEGFHEFEDEDYHVTIKKLPEDDRFLYLIYNTDKLEIHEQIDNIVIPLLILGIIVIILIGLLIGRLISNTIISPVIQLAKLVESSDPENLPVNFSRQFYNDEVGSLAKALEKAMRKIESFIYREKQFTRDASHELRTPVTIIKGALEIMQISPAIKDEKLYRPLQRIERSVKDMENLIETFLWLAREKASVESAQTSHIVPVIQNAIEQHNYLLADKSIKLSFSAMADPEINAPETILQIVISNLVRNAFHFTMKGRIDMTFNDDRFEIKDTGIGISKEEIKSIYKPNFKSEYSQGFGMGLTIVKRLCEQFGWALEIESRKGCGTAVRLKFNFIV